MKKFTSLLLSLILTVGFLQPHAQAENSFTCGLWTDVPESQMEILTNVCEYGFLQGMSQTLYGYNYSLSRAEAAVIGDRMIAGSATYDSWGEDYYGYATRLYNELKDIYTDLPENTYANEWAIKSMFYASDLDTAGLYSRPFGFMTGDGNSHPNTFRPYEGVNIVEMYKVLYESAEEAELLYQNQDFEYDGNPWYEDLLNYLEDEGAITDVDFEEEDIFLGSPISKHYKGFSTPIKREHAAQILYFMIESGLIDNELLLNHVNNIENTDTPDFSIADTRMDGDNLYVTVENLGITDPDGVDFGLSVFLAFQDEQYGYNLSDTGTIIGQDSIELGPFEIEEGYSRIIIQVDSENEWEEEDEDNNWLTLYP